MILCISRPLFAWEAWCLGFLLTQLQLPRSRFPFWLLSALQDAQVNLWRSWTLDRNHNSSNCHMEMGTFICIGSRMRHPASTWDSFKSPPNQKLLLTIEGNCVAFTSSSGVTWSEEYALSFSALGNLLCYIQFSLPLGPFCESGSHFQSDWPVLGAVHT